jgi:hypothetical protein
MSKKRRYLISAAVLAACVCIVIGVLAMLPPQTGVTKANFDRIEKGMTEKTVEEMFGGECQTFWRYETRVFFGHPATKQDILTWIGEDRSRATIVFDQDRLTKKTWTQGDESAFEYFKRLIRWPREK